MPALVTVTAILALVPLSTTLVPRSRGASVSQQAAQWQTAVAVDGRADGRVNVRSYTMGPELCLKGPRRLVLSDAPPPGSPRDPGSIYLVLQIRRPPSGLCPRRPWPIIAEAGPIAAESKSTVHVRVVYQGRVVGSSSTPIR
jgi:hypothetical protein